MICCGKVEEKEGKEMSSTRFALTMLIQLDSSFKPDSPDPSTSC